MIDITLLEQHGELSAILGARNSYQSRKKSDSSMFMIGPNDLDLLERLSNGGPSHAKYRRMIVLWLDIRAPLYWWKEFDTYKVGTVANSESTMHTIMKKPFDIWDFSTENLNTHSGMLMADIIQHLNHYRDLYLQETNPEEKKFYWWQIIQILPSSYNQLRTVMLNYEVLANIYKYRKDHKLTEWRRFCEWAEETLPYSDLFTGKEENV